MEQKDQQNINMKDYFKNGWNWVHLFGSCVLTIVLLLLTQWSYFFVFISGLLWEIMDECKKCFKWKIWFFDPAGFDFRDLLMNLVGILAAWLIN